MTTYNTGNPIGSKDPRDLYDNAENLDTAVNDTSRDTWSDRLGRSRKTMSGMERQFDAAEDYRETTFVSTQADKQNRFNDFIASSGYQFLGDYAAGIEITEYNQIIRDSDGEFWRLSGQVGLPYTTTGAGLPEDDSLTPLGDAVLRQELANPDMGAAMVQTKFPADGTFARDQGSKNAETVSVEDFMTQEEREDFHSASPSMDHSGALQRFFDFVGTSSTKRLDAHITGYFLVGAPLEFVGNSRTPGIRVNAIFQAIGASDEYVLTLRNATQGALTGALEMLGTGSTWGTRTWAGGIRQINSSRFSFTGRLTTRFFKYWGIRSAAGASEGNNSMSSFGRFRALSCGPRLGDLMSTVTAWENTGSSSSGGQRTVLTVDQLPNGELENAIVNINGEYHIVTALSASTVTVYPWVAPDSEISEMSWLIGGGAYITGGDSNLMQFDLFDVSGCGIGFRPTGFYNGNVSRVVMQANTIGLVTGNSTSSASFNLNLQNPYFELNDLNWLNSSSNRDGTVITAPLGINDMDLCVQLGAKNSSGGTVGTRGRGVAIVGQGRVLTGSVMNNSDGTNVGNTVALGPSQPCTHYIRTNSGTYTLQDSPGIRRWFTYVDLQLFFQGTGANGRPTGTITLQPEEGFTINGTSEYVLSGLTAAVMVHARLVGGTDWVISRYDAHTPASATYAVTNSVTDRAFDANSTSIEELADVLGTLIGDLRARGVVL